MSLRKWYDELECDDCGEPNLNWQTGPRSDCSSLAGIRMHKIVDDAVCKQTACFAVHDTAKPEDAAPTLVTALKDSPDVEYPLWREYRGDGECGAKRPTARPATPRPRPLSEGKPRPPR